MGFCCCGFLGEGVCVVVFWGVGGICLVFVFVGFLGCFFCI